VLGELERDAPAPVSLADLSRRLGAAKASLSHVLDALVEARFARRADGGFVLGRRLVELGGAYLAGVDQVSEFASLARSLPVASRETVQLSTMVGREVVYLARHDGTQPLRLGTEVGMRFPATCTATGKAMLATLPDSEVRSIFAGYDLPQRTARSLANVDELLADLRQVRQRGYAVDDEEANEGVVCVGVAIPEAPGGELFGVSVTILKSRLDAAYQAALVTDLRTLAAAMAHPLSSVSRAGHPSPVPMRRAGGPISRP
jgi:DNA-binding IclR family transcriptional regulator